MIGEELPVGGKVNEAKEEGTGQKDEGEIELELRSEEDEQGKDEALHSGEVEPIGQAIGHVGEKEETEGAVSHLDVFERERGEDHGLEEVAAANAGHDATFAEGVRGVVVELNHFDWSGEVEVVIVGHLIQGGVDARANPGDEDNSEKEGGGAGRGVWRLPTSLSDSGWVKVIRRTNAASRPRRIKARRTAVVTARMRFDESPQKDHDTDTADSRERDGWAA
jgi:hypothetical protein